MAYDNTNPASIDEIVLATAEYTGVKKPKKNLDFVQDWVDITVENEIRRGKHLREEKPIPDDSDYEYNVSNIDFLGSVARRKWHSKRTKNCNMTAYYPMSSRRSHSPETKTKNLKKCSMRIAELAVPSKRQCIDTWRHKSYLLPEFMVVRLKQYVMDQRPIVNIPEALYCFQRRRPRTQRSSKTYSLKKSQNKNENVYDLRKSPREMDQRTLCILFAHKITKILLKPLNLTLNLELKAVSRVVSKDISKLLCKCAFSKNPQYLPIRTDVANKITVWIAGILQDVTFKLLEEDLQDLEEEEGPVLDFIDDVVENVLNICEPHPVYVELELDTATFSKDEEIIGEGPDKSASPVQSMDLEIPRLEEIFHIDTLEKSEGLTDKDEEQLDFKDDTLTESEYFRNEINDIIDFVTKDSGDDIENVFDKTTTPQGEMEDVHDGDDVNTDQINDDIQNVMQSNEYEEVDENVDDGNVIDDFDILTEDDDKNSKKVIFIKTGLVNLHDLAGQQGTSPDDVLHGEQEQSNALHDKSSITFAEPNENLLSQINENDERQISPKEEADKTEETKSGDTQFLEEIVVGKLNSPLPSEKLSHHSQLNEAPQETTSADMKSDSETLDNKENDEFETEVIGQPSNEEEQQIMKTESDIAESGSATVGTDGKNQSEKTSKQTSQAELQEDKNQGIESDILSSEAAGGSEENKIDNAEVIDVGSGIEGAEGGVGGLEENQILSPETQPPNDYGFSQMEDYDDEQVSPTDKADRTDDTKSLDTQPVDNIIVDAFSPPPTEKQDSESALESASLQKDSERLDARDFDEFESKNRDDLSNEEVNKITEIESNFVETEGEAGISEDNKIDSSVTQSQLDDGLSKVKEDEKQISLKDQAVTTDETKSFDTQLIEKIIVDKLFKPKEKHKKQSKLKQKSKKKPKQTKPTTAAKSKLTPTAKPKPATTTKPHVVADKQDIDELEMKPSLEEVRTIVSIDSDILGSESGTSDKPKQPSSQSPKDQGWKVHLQTAPSWVTAWDQGRGEPSEDSLPIDLRPTRVTETELRKWCKDLENAFINLEMWSRWINTTCKETVLLSEQNESVCLTLARNNAINWNKLKRDINKDAELWTKLYHSTENTFKCLKREYNNIKIVEAEYFAVCACDKRKTR